MVFIITKKMCLNGHKTVQPESGMNGTPLSNEVPRETAPLPSSPPSRLDDSTREQVDTGCKFTFLSSVLTVRSIFATICTNIF